MEMQDWVAVSNQFNQIGEARRRKEAMQIQKEQGERQLDQADERNRQYADHNALAREDTEKKWAEKERENQLKKEAAIALNAYYQDPSMIGRDVEGVSPEAKAAASEIAAEMTYKKSVRDENVRKANMEKAKYMAGKWGEALNSSVFLWQNENPDAAKKTLMDAYSATHPGYELQDRDGRPVVVSRLDGGKEKDLGFKSWNEFAAAEKQRNNPDVFYNGMGFDKGKAISKNAKELAGGNKLYDPTTGRVRAIERNLFNIETMRYAPVYEDPETGDRLPPEAVANLMEEKYFEKYTTAKDKFFGDFDKAWNEATKPEKDDLGQMAAGKKYGQKEKLAAQALMSYLYSDGYNEHPTIAVSLILEKLDQHQAIAESMWSKISAAKNYKKMLEANGLPSTKEEYVQMVKMKSFWEELGAAMKSGEPAPVQPHGEGQAQPAIGGGEEAGKPIETDALPPADQYDGQTFKIQTDSGEDGVIKSINGQWMVVDPETGEIAGPFREQGQPAPPQVQGAIGGGGGYDNRMMKPGPLVDVQDMREGVGAVAGGVKNFYNHTAVPAAQTFNEMFVYGPARALAESQKQARKQFVNGIGR